MMKAGPDGGLAGRAILVTGATGYGVGAGVCDAVHAAGGRLILNGLTRESLGPALDRYPGSVGVVADVSVPDDARRLVAEATDLCGPVTGLVNNAGIGLSLPFYEATPEDFDRVYGVDVRGVWLVTSAFTNALLGSGLAGSIVHVSSVHAYGTMPRYAIYASAKAAVDGMTRGMAVELGEHGIRCNAIAPGYVHAEQNIELLSTLTADPEGWVRDHTELEQVLPRLIEPVDCGWAVVFLLSELSRCVTGQTLVVDSGLTTSLYTKQRTKEMS